MRFGLDRMRRLLTALGSPQERFAAIHVVGTNGKSSTVRMIAAMLQRHGVRAGRLPLAAPRLVHRAHPGRRRRRLAARTSPRAVDRARRAAEKVDRTLDADDRVTQFEALTAAAYAELAAPGVEVAVVEAGLGGRWDATNVIDAAIVGADERRPRAHALARADGARHRAREARGRRARARTLVLGADLHPDAEAEARVVADAGATIVARPPRRPPASSSARAAPSSGATSRVARAAAEACLGRLDDDAVRAAAASTLVPGRFEVRRRRRRRRRVVLDGAHNPGGIAALAASLPEFLAGRPLVAVVSVLDDKDAAAMLRALLPLCAGVVCTANANPRALSPATLASLTGQLGAPAARTPRRARPAPRRRARPRLAADRSPGAEGGVVLATGSIYLVADLLRPAGAGRGSTL